MAAKKQRRNAKKPSQTNKRAKVEDSAAARLAGHVAVVTGGSRGIGFAVARALAREGCNIVITGRDEAALTQAAARIEQAIPASLRSSRRHRPQVLSRHCEVQHPESVAGLFSAVRQHFGKIDVLVNNAGVAQPTVPVERTSLELWNEVIDTNLTGLFLCTRAALPLIARGGTIVNNLSVAAKTVFPNFAAYNASKHGALGFTLSLREELIPRGIRVVALMPGATNTEIWQQFWPDAPRERMIDVESVAQAVVYAALLPTTVNLSELILTPAGGAL
jgi:NAD(P)-dependent dehydrogenase (short-subunit alcohol dehydrogenase family)